MYSNQTAMLETPHGAMDSAVDQLVSPCSSTEYVMNYTWDPLEKNGLPYLVDVFASHDFQWLNFVAVNRGTCLEKFKTADAFPSMENPHRFICVFPNSVYVISELVGGNEKPAKRTNLALLCQINNKNWQCRLGRHPCRRKRTRRHALYK